MLTHRTALVLTGCALLGACQFSPLMNRIEVGEEPIVVFVGEAQDGSTDLFAASAGGGPAYQVTFNRPVESHPALNRDGTAVAFFRQPTGGDSTGRELVIMNLLNASERRIELPEEAGPLLAVAWRAGGTSVAVRAERGIWEVPAPPAEPTPHRLTGQMMGRAAIELAVAVGNPVFALVGECEEGGICSYPVGGGTIQQLSPTGTGPLRWGADSLAWFEQGRLEVRPLGPGRSRQVIWTQLPEHPREAAYAPGAGTPRQPETGLVVPK